jgi:ferredoxin/flavodoxin
MKHLFLYFSGTGNTKAVIDAFLKLNHEDEITMTSIEADLDFDALIKASDMITIGYPIYVSMMPLIMSDFLLRHKTSFTGKKIITVVTQMMFSGDGGALAYRLLKDVNVRLVHSIHINTPNNISDMRILSTKTVQETEKKMSKATKKIQRIYHQMTAGHQIRHGMRWYSRCLGFVLQRAYVKPFFEDMKTKLTIDQEACIHCNKCLEICPTHNLEDDHGRITTKGVCTICYRCVNACPVQAITLLGKRRPVKQYIRDTFN